MLFVPMLQAVALERGNNYERTPATSSEPVSKHIRVTEEQVNELSTLFHDWRSQHAVNDLHIQTSSQRMDTFLRYVASGGFHRQVAYTQGIAKSTAILHNQQVADFFLDIALRHISLPQLDELEALSIPMHDIAGRLKHVVLYIDGVIIPIQRPDHAGDAYFCGRHGKSCDSINVQYIVDRFGQVRHIISGLPGATHDKTAAEWSAELMLYLDQLPEDYVILGDPAYRNLHPAVLHTFTGRNLNPEQLAFNNQCTRLRQIVERTIGATELKWRINQLKENRYPAKYGPLFASKCTVATCVLHNMFTNFLR